MTNRNLGRFTINANFVERHPERVAEAFAIMRCVPVRTEMLFYDNVIEYTAISEKFPEVPKGMIVPKYDVRLTLSKSGNVELIEIKEIRICH